jgi:hypothetical protein
VPHGADQLTLTHPHDDDGPALVRRRRILYNLTALALVILMGLAVADAFLPVFGVDTAAESSPVRENGGELTVTYPELTRPALASPFAIEVVRPGGFGDDKIELAISRTWMEVWDENGFYPTPSAETGDDQWLVYEFDPPDGDTFRFFYDARLEPARQESVRGAVELRDGSAVLAAVEFQTKVRP